ncbi:MAG: rhomboid family intramembrane serine protease [Xenococcaceae cyanobacterium]
MLKLPTRKAYVTHLLIIINFIFFLIEIYLGGSTNLQILYSLGALIPQDVFAGQWWRLVSANFLHYGWIHFLSNMLSLYVIGPLVEFNLGRIPFLFIYLLSGIGSMFAFSILTLFQQENVILVGASAAIMGLVGTTLAIFLRRWWLEKTRRAANRSIAIILIIIFQFITDFLLPRISFFSHFFGLIFGFCLGIILPLFIKSKRMRK